MMRMICAERLVFVVILIFALFFMSGCDNGESLLSENSYLANQSLDTFAIIEDGSFSSGECEARGLGSEVIMFSSKYCGHCMETLPIFMEACEEIGIEPVVLYTTNAADREIIYSYGIEIHYTPTFLFGCKYYIGTEPKFVYKSRINDFVERG